MKNGKGKRSSKKQVRPLCFVLMPFGEKKDASGITIDFDAVYEKLIKPAILEAHMEPIRADEEQVGGIIHKPMFERLLLCDYAVADLTTANPNVFYELGVRHAVRPYSTVLIFAEPTRLPFDLGPVRGLSYDLNDQGQPTDIAENKQALLDSLRSARKRNVDSPLFQLVDGMVPQEIAREKTDIFRDRVLYSNSIKDRLYQARQQGVGEVEAVEASLGNLEDQETGVLVDLLLSYRAFKAWNAMIDLVGKMPTPVAKSILVQEQLGLALNRAGRSDQAERVLRSLIEERRASSETNGLLGRVYKDRWLAAKKAGNAARAQGELKKAISTYLNGFEADWRDAYPGFNAVLLMEISEPPDPRREKLIPIVMHAVERRIASRPDYWDYATLLELAVLINDLKGASAALGDALACVREPWEPETTAGDLGLIREARASRGGDVIAIEKIEAELIRAANRARGGSN